MKTEKKIYLVDDDKISLATYRNALEIIGIENIASFENGEDCLNNLYISKPDIIFLDYNMDGLTGFEVLKKIKRFDPNVFVIIVSAQDDMKIAINALKHGAFDYLIKGDDEIQQMTNVLERIERIYEEIKKANPTILQKLLSIF